MNVSPLPRYDLGRFCEWNKDSNMYDITSSEFVDRLQKLPVAGEVQITVDEERLDNLAYKLYGSTQYWWVLALYNNMPNFKFLRNGVIIRYFSIASLELLTLSLKTEHD